MNLLRRLFLQMRINFIQHELQLEVMRLAHCRLCIEGDKALLEDLKAQLLQLEARTI